MKFEMNNLYLIENEIKELEIKKEYHKRCTRSLRTKISRAKAVLKTAKAYSNS